MSTPTKTTETTTPSRSQTGTTTSTAGSATASAASRGAGRIGLVAALVALGGAALFLVAALAVVNRDDSAGSADGWAGAPVDPLLARPEFTLTDTEGRPFDFAAETGGQLTLLFFGYTSCPDVCPVHMATLSAALDMPGMPDPTVVFVTTDPQRDDPAHLREWLDQFDSGFIGLTGTVEEIAAAERAAELGQSSVINPEEPDYQVAHAAKILAYTPDDRLHLEYPFGVRREDWANDLPRLLEHWGGDPQAREEAP